MEVFESPCSVSHGASSLVAIGDPMWEPVRVNGGVAIQRASRVRADSLQCLARGNEFNTITFSICVENAGPAAASAAAIAFVASLPKTMADVAIATATSNLTLHDATIQSWTVDTVEQLGRYSITIAGGTLTSAS